MIHRQSTGAFEGAHTALAGLQQRDSYPLMAHGDPLAHRHGFCGPTLDRMDSGNIPPPRQGAEAPSPLSGETITADLRTASHLLVSETKDSGRAP